MLSSHGGFLTFAMDHHRETVFALKLSDVLFFMLINVKISITVSIVAIMSMKNTTSVKLCMKKVLPRDKVFYCLLM